MRRLAAALACTSLASSVLAACGLRISIGSLGPAGPSRTESKVARTADPRLVDVVSTLGFQDAVAAGTGIVLMSSGIILTNNHVIEGATAVRVTDIGNGRTYRATVVGYDAAEDIAVLRLHGASRLKVMPVGHAPEARFGEKVIALGNAGGAGGIPAIAVGRVTGLHQSIIATDRAASMSEHLNGLIRTNANIRAGDSGGPLLTATGRVIGIVTAASSGFSFLSSSEGFAIPVQRALRIARAIEEGRSSATVHIGPTGFLGVHLRRARVPSDPARTGARIASVIQGEPAARAGLAAGDVIIAAGGYQVSSPADIRAVIDLHHPGDAVALTWVDQAGHSHAAQVVLADGPAG